MSRPLLSRREFLRPWRVVAELLPRDELEPAPPPYLRPPGALAEERLLELCGRCGACREVCPENAIVALGPAYGDELEGTPAVFPRARACVLCQGLPCAAACPSGALTLVPREQVRMGLARIDPDRCFALQGQPCDYCVKECPLGEGALRLVAGEPRVVLEGCSGCGLCEYICPSTPAAISVGPRMALQGL